MTLSKEQKQHEKEAPALTFQFAKRHGAFILEQQENLITIAHRPDLNAQTLMELQRALQKPLAFTEMDDDSFNQALAHSYENTSDNAVELLDNMGTELDLDELISHLPKPQDLLDSQDDAPIIRLINAILTQAIKQEASDIHIETSNKQLTIRFRIDGLLRDVLEPSRALAPLLVSRIKVMARLDISEKRLPQDGRISLTLAGRQLDVRVSTLPAAHGERVVMRLLDKHNKQLQLSELGIQANTLHSFCQLIKQPQGIILLTGPTGSGKTTTLYALLSELNEKTRNILTVEDPVEYELPGIGQTQVNSKINMDFARGLRAILRQDPDIVMVGEIRDRETADIAIQASLTGHLVLSTLHTNSAIGAITRLLDMGIEPFLLSSTIIGVAAQRLVRKLCEHCKAKDQSSPKNKKTVSKKQAAHAPHQNTYTAVGCEHCHHTGYRGRLGIYELIAIDAKLKQLIHERASELTMSQYAHEHHLSINQDGLAKMKQGITTVEEVLRVTCQEQVRI